MCVMLVFTVSLLLALATEPQSQRPAVPKTSVAVGRVVDASNGRPIAGAIVTLFGSAAVLLPRAGQPRGAPAPRLMTNAAGQFVARGLGKGSLFLVVTKGGYVDASNAQWRPDGSAQRIDVNEGQRITDIEVRMWRHAVIAGTVIDEAGEPVVGARVQSYRRGFAAGRVVFTASASAMTDDRGMYRLANLVPNDYQIAVGSTQVAVPTAAINTLRHGTSGAAQRAELSRDVGAIGSPGAPSGTPFAMMAGGQTLTLTPGTATTMERTDGSWLVYPTTFYPASMSAAQGSVVSVKAGEERAGVDIQVQPFRAVRVSGQILAPSGYAGNIPIRLLPSPAEGATDLEIATTISDSDGAFTFPVVPPGQYLLKLVRIPRPPVDMGDATAMTVRSGSIAVSASGAPPVAPSIPPPIPADATLFAEAAIAVGDADVTGVTLALRAGPRVSGRVEFDGSGERPDAATLANVRVTLDPADGSKLPERLGFVTGRIDENGHFHTYGVPPGKYFVRASGLSDWFFKGAIYEGRDLADTPIDLTTDDISAVVLTFTDRPSSIAGTVSSGRAGDGSAVVLVFPIDSNAWTATGTAPRRMRTARANADGSYLLPAVPPGDYYVVAVHETVGDDWMDPASLEMLARSAEQVHLAEGERKTQDLRTTTIR
jgi:hypothetical protein